MYVYSLVGLSILLFDFIDYYWLYHIVLLVSKILVIVSVQHYFCYTGVQEWDNHGRTVRDTIVRDYESRLHMWSCQKNLREV